MQVTLRIKKKYFDLILAGKKRREYRERKPYYDRLFKNSDVTSIRLHYQSERQLVVAVHSIQKTREFYVLNLGRVLQRSSCAN